MVHISPTPIAHSRSSHRGHLCLLRLHDLLLVSRHRRIMLLQSHSIRLHRGRIELRLLLLRLRLLWLLIGRRDKVMMVHPGAVSGLSGVCGLGSTLVLLLGLLVMITPRLSWLGLNTVSF